MRGFAYVIAVVAAFFAHAATAEPLNFQDLNDKYTAAFNSKDYATVVAMYAPDAIMLPPSSGVLIGREKIERVFANLPMITGMQMKALDVKQIAPDFVREINGLVLTINGLSGPRQILGKNVLTWERIDGEWLITVDIWNFN